MHIQKCHHLNMFLDTHITDFLLALVTLTLYTDCIDPHQQQRNTAYK